MPHRAYRNVLLVLTLAAVASYTGACASLGAAIEKPAISLANVQLLQAGLLEQRYRLTLRVQNPNGIPIPIKGMSYAVKFAGSDFASGVTPKAFTVPANGEDMVDVDVTTNLVDTARQLMTWLKGDPDSLDYELSGKVQVDLPLVGAIPFSKSGSVDFQGLRSQIDR